MILFNVRHNGDLKVSFFGVHKLHYKRPRPEDQASENKITPVDLRGFLDLIFAQKLIIHVHILWRLPPPLSPGVASLPQGPARLPRGSRWSFQHR